MEMKNMKMSEEEQKKRFEPCAVMDAPKYPYGLQIRLDNDALEKLGLSELPEVGGAMALSARVVVESVSAHDNLKGGKDRTVCLQITDLALGSEPKKSSAAEDLYGKAGK